MSRLPRGRLRGALERLVGLDGFILSLVLCALAIAGVYSARQGPPNLTALFVIAAAFLCSEIVVLHFHVRSEAQTISLSEVVLTICLFHAQPLTLMLGHALGLTLALAFHRKQVKRKLFFNVSEVLITGQIGVQLFLLLSPDRAIGTRSALAALAGVLVYSASSAVLVSIAISMTTRAPWAPLARSMSFNGVVSGAVSMSTAVTGLALWSFSRGLTWVLIAPAAVVFLVSKSFERLRQRHDALQHVHEAASTLHASTDLDDGLCHVLETARSTLRSSRAIMLLSRENGKAVTAAAFSDGTVDRMKECDNPFSASSWTWLLEYGALVTSAGSRDETGILRQIGDELSLQDIQSAIVAPIVVAGSAAGVMLFADRFMNLEAFNADDYELANQLACQVGLALENGSLERSLSQLRELQAELAHQANHDNLTGLANRRLLSQHIEQTLFAAEDGMIGMILIDLDDFKAINDTFGHPVGDQLLRAVAVQIQRCARDGDLAVRLGGDEFALLLHPIESASDAMAVARRLLDALDRPFIIAGEALRPRCSIGIATAMSSAETNTLGPRHGNELLRNADIAMYAAKEQGKGRAELFAPSMLESARARAELSLELSQAADRNELRLVYQPVVDLAAERIDGFEALLRWHRSDGTVMMPAQFLPVAEQVGLMSDIGRWVTRTALEQLRDWTRDFGDKTLFMSVNVSALQLTDDTIINDVVHALLQTDVEPERLILEISESRLVDARAIDRLHELRRHQVRLAVDDFGTGYSSLSAIRTLPVDIVKIDRSFVCRPDDVESARYFKAIVALVEALGRTAVVEGIENEDELNLVSGSCRYVQGYLFGRPMSGEDATLLLAETMPEPSVTVA